jgi:hypothetical protein
MIYMESMDAHRGERGYEFVQDAADGRVQRPLTGS